MLIEVSISEKIYNKLNKYKQMSVSSESQSLYLLRIA